MTYLLKLWHRFTLGRTARILVASLDSPSMTSRLAYAVRSSVRHSGLLGITTEVVTRKSTDLPPGVVRIVFGDE